MNEMKTLTLNGQKYDCFVDGVARSMASWSAVIGSAAGENIAVSDASNYNLQGLRIFGKTTQNGTPTPDAPVDLVSVGDNGSINVSVCGKNLWDHTNDTVDMSSMSDWGNDIWRNAAVVKTLKPKTTYTMKCKVTCLSVPDYASVYSDQCGFVLYTSQGSEKNTLMAIDIGKGALVAGQQRILNGTFTTPENISDVSKNYRILYYTQRFLQEDGTAVYARIRVDDVQLEIGSTASDYVPYTSQKLSISTPNGLPSVPVESGGNYTDANGQQWVCDEIDFARGVYIRRTLAIISDGSIQFQYQSVNANGIANFYCTLPYKVRNDISLSSSLTKQNTTIADTSGEGYMVSNSTTTSTLYIRVSRERASTAEEFNALLVDNPVEFLFALETPIETPLSEEELAAYAALHTYKNHTTVSNDAGAYMELEYVMDAKKYIDSKISAGIIEATLE